jgi:hypothetical protein
MLFSGQLKKDDKWQIWEMNLKNLRKRQITSASQNHTDPAYLPGGRMVFTMALPDDSLKSGNSLFTSRLDGSDARRITFSPDTYFATGVLNDGRLLTISRQVFPSPAGQVLTVMRPDGTKSDIFCMKGQNSTLSTRAWETIDGKIAYIERDDNSPERGFIVAVNYNRPMHTRRIIASELQGDFGYVFPEKSGKMIVSYKKSESEHFALYEFDPVNNTLDKLLYGSPDYDVVEAVVAGARTRPKKLPSEVDMGVKTGLLMCQDINVLDENLQKNNSLIKASKIEVLGLNKSYGIVEVEKDGSFYMKVMADTPFRIQALDEKGNVINGLCAWMTLRPNERRGCVGCHEDPEIVPENRVPFAVKKQPVKLPVHVEKVKEKKVELE